MDLRVDRNGRPWILEVNANPDFAPDAGLARMAGVNGMDYTALVQKVVELALESPLTDYSTEQWELARRLSGGDNPELAALA